MTEIKDILHIKKNHNFKILIVPEGRKVYFEKDCLETVTILRKVGDQAWQVIANEVHAPYIDSEKFELPVLLLYKVIFQNVKDEQDIVEVHLS
jgi:hypothetical protein